MADSASSSANQKPVSVQHGVQPIGKDAVAAIEIIALVLFVAFRIARRTPSEEPDQPSFSESLIAAQTVSPIETGRE